MVFKLRVKKEQRKQGEWGKLKEFVDLGVRLWGVMYFSRDSTFYWV